MARPRKDDPRYLTGELPRAPGERPSRPVTMPEPPRDQPPFIVDKELDALLKKAEDYLEKFPMKMVTNDPMTPEELLMTVILSRAYIKQITSNPHNLLSAKTRVMTMLNNVRYRMGKS